MYTSARSELVPVCLRVHCSTAFKASDTTSIRCGSSRWAIEMIAMRGRPSGVKSSEPAWSGSPVLQSSNPGAASTLLNLSARSWRSRAG